MEKVNRWNIDEVMSASSYERLRYGSCAVPVPVYRAPCTSSRRPRPVYRGPAVQRRFRFARLPCRIGTCCGQLGEAYSAALPGTVVEVKGENIVEPIPEYLQAAFGPSSGNFKQVRNLEVRQINFGSCQDKLLQVLWIIQTNIPPKSSGELCVWKVHVTR